MADLPDQGPLVNNCKGPRSIFRGPCFFSRRLAEVFFKTFKISLAFHLVEGVC